MSRPTIDLPESFSFATELTVRITDVNYGGHLGNDAVLSLLHEARIRFLKHYGYRETDFGGCGVIMTDAQLIFAAEAFAGDRLRVEIAMTREGRLRCELFYRVTDADGGKDVARAMTGMVCFDYEKKKVMKVPEGITCFSQK